MSIHLFAENYEACVNIIAQKIAWLEQQVQGYNETEQLRLKLEKEASNFHIEADRLAAELKEHFAALDVSNPGNHGWEARFLLLMRMVVKATEKRVRKEMAP